MWPRYEAVRRTSDHSQLFPCSLMNDQIILGLKTTISYSCFLLLVRFCQAKEMEKSGLDQVQEGEKTASMVESRDITEK